jgi:hypothetical protein
MSNENIPQAVKEKIIRFSALQNKAKNDNKLSSVKEYVEYMVFLKNGISYEGQEEYERPYNMNDMHGHSVPPQTVTDTRSVIITVVRPEHATYQNFMTSLLKWYETNPAKIKESLQNDFNMPGGKAVLEALAYKSNNIKKIHEELKALENARSLLKSNSKKRINSLREKFINKADISPYFGYVDQAITFYIPGLTIDNQEDPQGFKVGRVTFLPSSEAPHGNNQNKITYTAPPGFDFNSNPYTKSLIKRMERENYIVDALAAISNPALSDEEAIKAYDDSLNLGTDYAAEAINRTNSEGNAITTRKEILMEHRSDSKLVTLLRNILEAIFGKKEEQKKHDNAPSIGAGRNRYTTFATKTTSHKELIDPLQKIQPIMAPKPSGNKG